MQDPYLIECKTYLRDLEEAANRHGLHGTQNDTQLHSTARLAVILVSLVIVAAVFAAPWGMAA